MPTTITARGLQPGTQEQQQLANHFRRRRRAPSPAQEALQWFITILKQVPFTEGAYMLSMDLFMTFLDHTEVDIHPGFMREFGRQVTRACQEGRLPFKRTIKTKARLAAFEGIDATVLKMMLAEIDAS